MLLFFIAVKNRKPFAICKYTQHSGVDHPRVVRDSLERLHLAKLKLCSNFPGSLPRGPVPAVSRGFRTADTVCTRDPAASVFL